MTGPDIQIGAKVEHPQFGAGIVTDLSLTTYTIFFLNRGDKEIARNFEGLKLLEPSKAETSSSGGRNSITLEDLEKVFTNVLKRYADFPETIEMGDKWKKGMMILQPGDPSLKSKEIPIETFFHKITMVRDRLRVLEQRINSNDKLDEEEKVGMQQYITKIYGSLTTFNVFFKHKSQQFVGEKGDE